MDTSNTLSIGDVATKSGVRVETVRYYEREGLIPKAIRAHNGYRRFVPEAVTHIRLIQSAQSLGFTLQEVGELLSLKANATNSCRSVRETARTRLTDIEQKIAVLTRMRDALLPLVEACKEEKPIADCPILNALDEAKPTKAR